MAEAGISLTRATRGVLAELIAHPAAVQYVTQLHSATGLSAGQIYGVLARLEAVRWVESGWDAPTSKQQGWPRRRHYRLSSDGVAMAKGALASSSQLQRGGLRPATGAA